MKISIAVVDANFKQRSETILILDEYIRQRHLEIQLFGFYSGPELFSSIKEKGRYDIYILETKMPEMNGIVIARELRSRSDPGKIIYYTEDTGYAVHAFEVRAVNYIIKPASREKMFAALDEVVEQIEREGCSPVTELRTGTGYVRVPADDITYVNIVNRALCYHMRDGSSIRSVSLRGSFREAVDSLLELPSFYIAGAGMLINLSYIRVFSNEAIFLNNGEMITPPKSSYKSIRAAWKMFK